jgi:hypothetical protein
MRRMQARQHDQTAETAPESALLQKRPPRQSRESDDDARFQTASERPRAQHNLTPLHTVSMVWAHGPEAWHALVHLQSRESDDDARFRTASERPRAQHNLTPPHTVSMVRAHGPEALHALVHLRRAVVRRGKQAAAARLNS